MNQNLILLFVLFALTGNVFAQSTTDSCNMPALPTILFKNTVFLSKKAKLQLDSVVKIAEQYPFCKIQVTGHAYASNKPQQRSWDKVASIVIYMRRKGLRKQKILFQYGMEGDPNEVNLSATIEEGSNWAFAPHWNLSLLNSKYTDYNYK